jgi:hypothetical protein
MIPDPKRREKAMVNGKVPVYWQKKAYKGETAEAVIETAIPQQQWLHTGRGTVSLAEIQNSVEALDDDDDDDDDDVEIRGQVDRVIDNEVFPMEDTIDTSSVVSESDSIASNTTTLVGQHYKIPYDTYDRLMSSTRELINTIQANEGIVEDLEPAAKVSMRILSDLLADELGT